jgi:hypothetical protein
MADVTSRKRAGHGRFKVVRQTLHRPASRRLTFAQKVGTSDQIAARITDDGGFGRPFRVRKAANSYEKTLCAHPLRLPVALTFSIRSSALSPSSAVTEDSYLTSTFGCDRILLVRYCDIDAESARSLTNIVTFYACEARCMTA